MGDAREQWHVLYEEVMNLASGKAEDEMAALAAMDALKAAVAASVLEQAPPERAPEEAPGAPDGATEPCPMCSHSYDEALTNKLDAMRYEEALYEDREKWSFDTTLYVAQRILDTLYPAHIFNGSSGDSGPRFVAALRETLGEVRAALSAPGTGAPVPAPQLGAAIVDEHADDLRALAQTTDASWSGAPAPLGVGGDEEAEQSAARAPDGGLYTFGTACGRLYGNDVPPGFALCECPGITACEMPNAKRDEPETPAPEGSISGAPAVSGEAGTAT